MNTAIHRDWSKEWTTNSEIQFLKNMVNNSNKIKEHNFTFKTPPILKIKKYIEASKKRDNWGSIEYNIILVVCDILYDDLLNERINIDNSLALYRKAKSKLSTRKLRAINKKWTL